MTGVCPDCAGTLEVIAAGEFVEVECGCGYSAAAHRSRVDPETRKERRRDAAGFPAEFAGKPFHRDDDNRDAVVAASDWLGRYAAWRAARAEDPDCSVELPLSPALWGRHGRGKTHLLVRVGERLIDEADCTVLFRTARRLLRELQDFDRDGGDRKHKGSLADQAWERALRVDVLLLDDLGAQRATDWRADRLAELIDERHSQQLPIALTINMPPGAWEQPLDMRTASRLRGITFPVELDGDRDRRVTPLPSGPNQQ